MMRELRKFHKTVFGVIAIAMIATSMIGFGVNFRSGKATRYAVRVNEEQVSFEEFYRERRQLEDRFRSQLGGEYQNLLRSLGINLSQRVADNMIVGLIMTQLGKELGMTVSNGDVATEITELMNGRIEQYEGVLAQLGLSAPAFEEKVRRDLLRRRVSSLFSDVALPSDSLVRAKSREELATFSIEVAAIDPKQLVSEVPAPTVKQVSSFYEAQKMTFEEPEKVSYRYALIDAARVESSIAVEREAVEDFYEGHRLRYQLPDKARVSIIKLNYPKNADDAAKQGVAAQADSLLKELSGGASFAELAKKSSMDEKTKNEGGDLGWVVAGTLGKEFDEAIFRDEPSFEPQVVKSDSGVSIVRLSDFQADQVKPLKEVEGEIIAELKKEEVPGYLSHEAETLFSDWTSGTLSLSDFVKAKGISIAATEGLLGAAVDPSAETKGLTAQVIATIAEPRQLIDLGERFALIEVIDHRERLVPPVDEIRERVAAAFREGEADKKAEQRAAELLEKVRSGAGTLSEVGSSLGVSVAREVGITKASGGDGLLRDTLIREELIRSGVEGATLNKATKSGGKWVVAQVSAILEPTAEELEKKLASVRSELKTQEGSLVLSSVLNTIKARAETDIDASILAD